MGGITSKLVDDVMGEPKGPSTPKNKPLRFDPRSPSDNVSRTPITITSTPDNGQDITPANTRVFKVGDPRSPNDEVTRTPIVFEKKEGATRPKPLNPKTQMNLDSFLCKANDESFSEESDPRSPTTKVPRTPLEVKTMEFDEPCSDQTEDLDESQKPISFIDDERESVSSQEGDLGNKKENTLVKKLFTNDGSADKVRRPLGLVQSTAAAKTPKDLLQAKHCRNIEDEYNKNIRSLLPESENTVKSNTEFVETI